MSLCLPSCQLFEVHGSKLKPHPIGNLGQASVKRIVHSTLFFRIRKNPFNGFFTFGVKVLIFRGIPGIVGQLLIVIIEVRDR